MYRFLLILIFIYGHQAANASDTTNYCSVEVSSYSKEFTKVCNATIINRQRIVFGNSCIREQKRRRRNTQLIRKYELVCDNGLIRKSLSGLKRSYQSHEDSLILNLTEALPINTRPTLTGKYDPSSCKITLDKIERKVDITKVKLTDAEYEKYKFAPVTCLNMQGEEQVLGYFNANKEFKYSNALNSKAASNNSEYDDTFDPCLVADNCVKSLIEPSLELYEQLDDIILKYQNEENATQRDKLISEIKEIERSCNETGLSQKLEYKVPPKTWKQKAMGNIETGAISLFRTIESINPFDKEDFLMTQFKNVESIKENLTDAQIQFIFNKVKDQDISNIDKVRKLTSLYAAKTFEKIVDDMSVFTSEAQKESFILKHISELESCTNKAVSSSGVKKCAADMTNRVAVEVGELELEKQIMKNFADTENTLTLTQQSKDEYKKCLNTNINKEVHKNYPTTTKVRSCVYKGIIVSYQETRRNTLREMLPKYTLKKNNEALINRILNNSNSCKYAPLVNTAKSTNIQFQTLSNMDTEKFATAISECVDNLKLIASADVVQLAVENNETIRTTYDDIEKKELSKLVNDNFLQPCLKKKKTTDATQCVQFITVNTTLEAATIVIEKEFKRKLSDINLPRDRKDAIVRTNLALYKTCKKAEQKRLSQLLPDTQIDERRAIKCFSDAISNFAYDLTGPSITSALKENNIDETVSKKALGGKTIERIKSRTKMCIQESVTNDKTLESFQKNMSANIDSCVLNTEKSVIKLIAKQTLDEKAVELSLSANDTDRVKRYIEDKLNSSTRQTIKDDTSNLTPEIIKLLAAPAIEKSISGYKHIFTRQEYENKVSQISNNLKECINNRPNTESDICLSITTKDAYLDIGLKLIEHSIKEKFPKEDSKAQDIFKSSTKELEQCFKKISNDINAQNEAKKCITTNLSIVVTEVASRLLNDLNKFANEDGKRRGLSSTSTVFKAFERCMNRTKTQEFETALNTMETCTSELEIGAKLQFEQRFTDVYGVDDKEDAKQAIKLLMQLQRSPKKQESDSKKNENVSSSTSSDSAPSLSMSGFKSQSPSTQISNPELISLVEQLGVTLKYSCMNNKKVCSEAIKQSQNMMKEYFRDNPSATTEQSIKKIKESPLVTNIMSSKLSETLKENLHLALMPYMEKDGILSNAIDNITNTQMLTSMFNSKEGKELKIYIMKLVDEDKVDTIETDNKARRLLARMLTNDIGDDSFSDQLIYGLVQSKLNNYRKRSSGFTGIFKEFKIKMGDIFRIIDRDDFDWNIIKKTKTGKKARELLSKEILYPAVLGTDLTKQRSTSKKYKNRQEQLVNKFEELVQEGVMEAKDL